MNVLRRSYFWSHFETLSTVFTSIENIILFSLPLLLLLLISDDVIHRRIKILRRIWQIIMIFVLSNYPKYKLMYINLYLNYAN